MKDSKEKFKQWKEISDKLSRTYTHPNEKKNYNK